MKLKMKEGYLDWSRLAVELPSNHIFEGKIERTRIGGRRCKQLLIDRKEKRRYWNLKERTLDCTL
jgi:hypothetical protein